MNEIVSEPAAKPSPFSWKPIVGFCVLALITLAFCQMNFRHQVTPEAGVTTDLPDKVGNYWGKDQEVSEGERVILPKDTKFGKKAYDNASGDVINCQIVLSGGDKRSIHRPEICLPGQGWNIRSTEVLPVPLQSGKTLDVTKLRLVREVEVAPGVRKPLTMLFLYWFVGDNYTTANHLDRILRTNLDMLLYSRAHRWAYVIVSAPVMEGFRYNGKNEAQTLEMLKSFLPEIVPTFQKSEMASALSAEPLK